jgi:LDH2 family malate/lactate/ureidoglycolate dehydrogenase
MVETETRVSIKALKTITQSILTSYGADFDQANIVSDVMIWCDCIGKHNQGVWRLGNTCKRLENKLFSVPCKPKIEKMRPSIMNIDGRNGLGHFIAVYAMKKAIRMAKETGIGIVTVKNSNYYGAGCYYTHLAAMEEMVGFALSNSFPKVAVYGGRDAIFGTNPISFGAPVENSQHIMVDMATASSAGSTIRKCKENKQPVPHGTIIDQLGRSITDPYQASNGILLPASGPKGFGLALVVEILSGILSGSGFSHDVKSMYKNFEEPGNNGHFFIAINIKDLIPIEIYYQRISHLLAIVLSSNPLPNMEVRYPGQSRWSEFNKSEKLGVKLDEKTRKQVVSLAKNKNISIPW